MITDVVVWSQVEVGVAVIAACLPTLRPLFHGNSPETLMGSIRSMLSLSSSGRAQRISERRGSDSEALASGISGTKMESVHVSESKSHLHSATTTETRVSGGLSRGDANDGLPAGQIGVQNGISFKEERLG